MMSFTDANKGAPAPKLRLSRKGLVVWASAASVAAVILPQIAGWGMDALATENSELKARIARMDKEAAAEREGDPKEKRIAELSAKLQSLQISEQRVQELSNAIVQSASAMPEFKSPQYKEPYMVLLGQINELNAAVQTPHNEVAQ